MQFLICLTDRSQVEAQLYQDPLADHQSHSIDQKWSQDYHGRQRSREGHWKAEWAGDKLSRLSFIFISRNS